MQRKNVFSLQLNMRFTQTSDDMMEVCDVYKIYTFATVETYFFVPEPL